jgi:ubiquinone biosynthesis monooxygenase Coq7
MALPGDKTKKEMLESMLMVNHAGEYGAKRIYQGQLDHLSAPEEIQQEIEHMAEQEEEHLNYFKQQLITRRIRPTALMPFWHCFGYGIGMVTARMGVSSAMMCTKAIEEVIDEHYELQINDLDHIKDESALKEKIKRFQQEELEHKDSALNHLQKQQSNPLRNKILGKFIANFCKLAINLSKRI